MLNLCVLQAESRSGGGYDDRPYIHTKYELFEGVSVREAAQVGLDNNDDNLDLYSVSYQSF